MRFTGIVSIHLREDLLDPQGKAVMSGLKQLGFDMVENVRVGKQLKVTFQAEDGEQAVARLRQMCEKLLVNPVIEDYDTVLMAGDEA